MQELSPDQVQQAVIDSGLRGRGGAGFPTGKKWSFVPRDLPGPRWLICNCDEMEPGTYKDRVLLEANPYSLIEGMVLACYAIGVRHAFIFIRRGYEQAAANLRRAIAEAEQAGLLGENILGSGFSCDIDVHVSAGRYICGEETALMNALEGQTGQPARQSRPFRRSRGSGAGRRWSTMWRPWPTSPASSPTAPEWFKGLARHARGGRDEALLHQRPCAQPGCFELPLGHDPGRDHRRPVRRHAAGEPLQGLHPRRRLDPLLHRRTLDVPMDFDTVAKAGSRLGTGGIVVFDQDTCMVAATLNLIRFYARESCGWCTPCREGLPFVQPCAGDDRGGRGERGAYRHPAGACQVPELRLLRPGARRHGPGGWAAAAFRG